jgi:putative Holliday junction resolvase
MFDHINKQTGLIKYLGIDWGEKRIGLAVADNETRIAVPLFVVKDIKGLAKVIVVEDIILLVLGKPSKLDGSAELGKKFLIFQEQLEKNYPGQIVLFDERMTTKAAQALAGDKKTKAPKDAIAAMIILQDYLDAN